MLSDIHGLLPVLDAVLAEPDVQTAELIVITGDHHLRLRSSSARRILLYFWPVSFAISGTL